MDLAIRQLDRRAAGGEQEAVAAALLRNRLRSGELCFARLEGAAIGDFGYGEALLAKAVSDRHVVHSFDHVAKNESVTSCDMAHTPLESDTLDVSIFSLSLMGANFNDYLREAWRTLKLDGRLLLWVATSRFDDPERFARDLARLGFDVSRVMEGAQFTEIQAIKVDREPEAGFELRFRLGV